MVLTHYFIHDFILYIISTSLWIFSHLLSIKLSSRIVTKDGSGILSYKVSIGKIECIL